jgi:hypothetical protein
MHPRHSRFAHSLAAYAGFIKPAAIRSEKAAKCPELLCPTRVIPPLGRRDPSPGPSVVARTGSFAAPIGLSPPSVFSLVQRVLAGRNQPCCPRQLPDVILRIVPWMLNPIPRRYTVCLLLFLPRRHRPSPRKDVGRLPASHLRITISPAPRRRSSAETASAVRRIR